ncbi:tetratricopeptide repeat protein [Aestuariivivens sediminicola]|uniref:tetratricopeptide repeat protein n=1 Tax=Aestuariivivens sediminicola TaxID=2913560 RepID=UPI001F5900EB|nr:tetratricopeptide repeat protein [Aestuariivivens sediminicola]
MKYVFVFTILLSMTIGAQNDAIAKDYYAKGEFEKALAEYKKLYYKSPSNINYINQVVSTYQQLEQYDEAEVFLLNILERINYPAFLVELGYNFQLKDDTENAQIYYNKALAKIDDNPNHVFGIARLFQSHSLLDEALMAYSKAKVLNPEFNFNLQMAQIYGEQGNIENMFSCYMDFAASSPVALNNVKRAINNFITEDGDHENNIILRKVLLRKIQENPDLLWNKLLSWLFIQQKDFRKAFAQEKAIFNRGAESLSGLEELAQIAVNDEQEDIALEVYTFLIDTAQDIDTQLAAHHNILLIRTKLGNKEDYPGIQEQYLNILNQYGTLPQTLDIQISYAHFLAFYSGQPEEATRTLEQTLELPLNPLQQAKVKLELGDILVLQEQFNKALIYYSQIQRNLKNSTISQEARFKVAKASYYKGDFKWAESQLNILKSSTSQLIANDALELKLLISDNKYEDSTQTALKLYAKADLLTFQNKKEAAIVLLDRIIEEHKTEPIVAQALFKQGQLFEAHSQFEKAVSNYERIRANYREGILMDDALYRLARIYNEQYNEKEKAKLLLEEIIFNHDDSIYFVDARKQYRILRGDAIN